jgi:streptogramin lyase
MIFPLRIPTRRMRGGAATLALLFFMVIWPPAGVWAAAPARVSEAPLRGPVLYPGALAVGPEGGAWLGALQPAADGPSVRLTPTVGTVDAEGTFSAEALPAGRSAPVSAMVAGLGVAWFASGSTIGRIDASGVGGEYPAPGPVGGLALGPEGDLWFSAAGSESLSGAPETIGRMTSTGQVASFTVPTRASRPEGVTIGPEGAIWFTEYFGDRIGRLSPDGSVSEFRLPRPEARPSRITLGPDGDLWFTEQGAGAIGRITPEGTISEYTLPAALGFPGDIVAGPDGRLWFTVGPRGLIGRITPAGRTSSVALSDPEDRVEDLARGPEGSVWFSASRIPCNGGGGGCQEDVPDVPGVVGQVVPGPLRQRILAVRSSGRIRVRLACEGGDAGPGCAGRMIVGGRRGGGQRAVLGSRRYRLGSDSSKWISIGIGGRSGASGGPTQLVLSIVGKGISVHRSIRANKIS